MKQLNMPTVEQAAAPAAEPRAVLQPVNEETVRKAAELLRKYRDGKKNLESKIVAEEEFWRRRQWRYIDGGKEQTSFATPWLFNAVTSKHADVMDSYPTANLLARQSDDVEEAKKLSSIIPVVNAQNDFETTYSDVAWYTLKHGGGVYGVFWDAERHNGLGDIVVREVDFLNLYWEPGISHIQNSANVFHTELVNVEYIKQAYDVAKNLTTKPFAVTEYFYDDKQDSSQKAMVIDWYYRKRNAAGKIVLHLCKFVESTVLFSTENDPDTYPDGWYAHGKYPFVVQCLYPVKGSLCGDGIISVGADTQMQIDLLNRATIQNALFGAGPRYFARRGCGVDLTDFLDATKPIVEVENASNINEELKAIETKSLPAGYLNLLEKKKEELKYGTANQDANNGVAPSGITAASAIAALQETGGKNSRSINKAFHRAFKEVVYQELELIRQFYDAPRVFRIIPDDVSRGESEFVSYQNTNIVPQPQIVGGKSMGFRVPEFDIEVTVEKASPYKKMEINELALNFYKLGFFDPQLCDQVLSCLKMMDFDGKDKLEREIAQTGTMAQELQKYRALAMSLAAKYEPQLAAGLTGAAGAPPVVPGGADVKLGEGGASEPARVQNAREQARASAEAR